MPALSNSVFILSIRASERPNTSVFQPMPLQHILCCCHRKRVPPQKVFRGRPKTYPYFQLRQAEPCGLFQWARHMTPKFLYQHAAFPAKCNLLFCRYYFAVGNIYYLVVYRLYSCVNKSRHHNSSRNPVSLDIIAYFKRLCNKYHNAACKV